MRGHEGRARHEGKYNDDNLVLQREFIHAGSVGPADVCDVIDMLDSSQLANMPGLLAPSRRRTNGAGSHARPETVPALRSALERFFKPALQPHQKRHRHKHQCHMMMPAAPRAHFVVAHAQFLFANFEATLNWPAHATGLDQPLLHYLCRRVTQVRLEFAIAQAAPQNQPDLRAWQPMTHTDHPHKGKLGGLWPLSAFLNDVALPSRGWQGCCQRPHLLRCGRISHQVVSYGFRKSGYHAEGGFTW
jgi:hypothetical protein